MRKISFFLTAALWLMTCGVSAQVFVIERGSNTTFTFSNIKAAVDALQDNDRLYIPPGTHSLTGYTWTGYEDDVNLTNILVITKKVSIFGAGYNNGANSTVITGGTFIIGKGASGSLITGIQFGSGYGDYSADFYLDNVSNCIVSRCKVQYDFSLAGTGNNILISECDFNIYVATISSAYTNPQGNGLVATFDKCIFRGSGSNFYINTANIFNSMFLQEGISLSAYSNTSFSNNIFIIRKNVTNQKNESLGNSNTFTNNLWVGGYPSSDAANNNVFVNEITREPYANVFADPDNGDYHLKAECSGKNAGSDGTDVGIYGTAIPFKESKLPSIPHFAVKTIATETNAEGNLPVYIKIEAQNE